MSVAVALHVFPLLCFSCVVCMFLSVVCLFFLFLSLFPLFVMCSLSGGDAGGSVWMKGVTWQDQAFTGEVFGSVSGSKTSAGRGEEVEQRLALKISINGGDSAMKKSRRS